MGSRKAIVVGGSVGGLFVGGLLRRAGWEIAIYERSPTGLAGKGAGLVPQQEVAEILREIQRPDVLRTGVVAEERIFLERSGQVIGALKTPQAQISWDLLFTAFRSEVPDACYHLGKPVVRVETDEEQARVVFADGSEDIADLVIGADGIGSVVRQAVAPGTEPRYAGYAAYRGLAPETQLPEQSAELVSERFTFYNGPRSQYLGYLVAGADGSTRAGERRYNWVWYRVLTEQRLAEALTSDAGERRQFSAPAGGLSTATKQELHKAAKELLPPVLGEILLREERPFLQAIFDYEAPRMRHGRIVLLGDAAYVVRPHTAMGISKAAGDAMTLRDVLIEEPTLDAALQSYEERRMAAGSAIAAYGQRLGAELGMHD
ncbi:FAD binding domain-containing protein [Terriglobus tenax]|uniref:FAD binding domain-containing protein n=1 Tax=Terriglobus tenax TaxID=1111115 RepID=UPI0021E0AF03|nr:FAD-dependent monooxygenase [Terriglobus tenax]